MRRFLPLLALVLAATAAHAQSIVDGFPAIVPLDDSTSAPIHRWIAPAPAGANGFVRSSPDGRFVFGDGSAARFVGVTLEWSACIPDSAQAMRIAARLAKLGVNLVRMRYFENSYRWGQASSILDVSAGARTLHPEQMRRFDWLIHQLRIHGIYTYLALQSARVPLATDGYGALADSALWLAGGLHHLYPQGRATLKHHARLILDHVNPFTGRAYRDEPAIAMLEIMDRGSIVSLWKQAQTDYVPGGYTLSHAHSRRLDTLYADFLRTKYGARQSLDAAWRMAPPPGGFPSVIEEGSFEGEFDRYWTTASYDGPTVTPILTQNDSVPDGRYAMTLRVRNAGGEINRAYMMQLVPLEYNALYRLSFRAKAGNAAGRNVYVVAVESSEDGTYAGLSATIPVTSAWASHEAVFFTPAKLNAPVALYFFFGDVDGDLSIDDVELRMVEPAGLQPDEKLDEATVARIPWGSGANRLVASQRVEDQAEFMMGLDRELFTDLGRYVRDTVGARQIVTGAGHTWASHMMEGSVQRAMDFTTVNAGWDWTEAITGGTRIRNYSPLRQGYAGFIHEMSGLAHDRQPFVATLSLPYPNRYIAESMLLLPAYAMLQQWDAIIFDVWADDASFDTSDVISSGEANEMAKNPVVNALLPAVATMFRDSMVAPAETTIRLQHSREQIAQIPRFGWGQGRHAIPGGVPGWAMAIDRIVHDSLEASDFTQSSDISFPTGIDREVTSDTRELRWEYNEGVFTINTDRVQAATGHLARSSGARMDNLEIEVLSDNETATVVWYETGEAPTLTDPSARGLLVIASHTEATGMTWADSSTITGWGTGPMLVEPVRVRLRLIEADDVLFEITPLDSTGAIVGRSFVRGREVVIDQREEPWQWFQVTISYLTSAGESSTAASSMRAIHSSDGERVTLEIRRADATGGATIDLYDAVGRRCASIDAGRLEAGTSRRALDVRSLASGSYTAVLRDGGGTLTARFSIVR